MTGDGRAVEGLRKALLGQWKGRRTAVLCERQRPSAVEGLRKAAPLCGGWAVKGGAPLRWMGCERRCPFAVDGL